MKRSAAIKHIDGLTMVPLQPGWLVVYPGIDGLLRGGRDDRKHGMVHTCEWDGTDWTVYLTDGQRLLLRDILSVAKTDETGRVLSAWLVQAHGYDGNGQR